MTDTVCELLTRQHDRQRFRCGVAELDDWFQRRAWQDQERHVAAVYVLTHRTVPQRLAGFYSLSAMSVVLSALPESARRRLPRYPLVPAVLIGRLARDVEFSGTGRLLLADALQRALRHSASIAAAAVVVDALDESAAGFYRHFGFEPLTGDSRRLFLAMGTIERLFKV